MVYSWFQGHLTAQPATIPTISSPSRLLQIHPHRREAFSSPRRLLSRSCAGKADSKYNFHCGVGAHIPTAQKFAIKPPPVCLASYLAIDRIVKYHAKARIQTDEAFPKVQQRPLAIATTCLSSMGGLSTSDSSNEEEYVSLRLLNHSKFRFLLHDTGR